jgi:hypothetical protein
MFHVKHGLERECVFYRAVISWVASARLKLTGHYAFSPNRNKHVGAERCRHWVARACALTPETTRFAHSLHVAMNGLALDGCRALHRQIGAP